MKTRILTATATALTLAMSPAAFAETGAADAAAPAAPAAEAEAKTFSDADISGFVNALGAIQKIQADATLDANAKQTQMASAIEAAGLDVATFNAIATQSQSDAELQQKIAAHQAAHQPTP